MQSLLRTQVKKQLSFSSIIDINNFNHTLGLPVMRINELLSENNQLDELSLAPLGRAIGKGVSAVGSAVGGVKGAWQGAKDQYTQSRDAAQVAARNTVGGSAAQGTAPATTPPAATPATGTTTAPATAAPTNTTQSNRPYVAPAATNAAPKPAATNAAPAPAAPQDDYSPQELENMNKQITAMDDAQLAQVAAKTDLDPTVTAAVKAETEKRKSGQSAAPAANPAAPGTAPAAPTTTAAAPAANTRVPVNVAKQDVDQAINAVAKVRSRDRQNVVTYAKGKIDALQAAPAPTVESVIYSKFLGKMI
jgi:hypothetical protein